MPTRVLSDAVHGPSQLCAPAAAPYCRTRQSRTFFGEDAAKGRLFDQVKGILGSDAASAMQSLVDNPSLRAEMRCRSLRRAAQFSWQRTARVTLPDGTVFEGVIKQSDEYTIALIGKDGWYRSWSRDAVKVVIHDPLETHRALTEKYTDSDMHNLFAYLETLK